jgi:hypothetical protein
VDQINVHKVIPSDYGIFEGKQKHCVLSGKYFVLKSMLGYFVFGLVHYISTRD